MLWEIELRPKERDPERDRAREEYDLLTHAASPSPSMGEGRGGGDPPRSGSTPHPSPPPQGGREPCGADIFQASAHGFLVEGDLQRPQIEQLMHDLLLDPLVENGKVSAPNPRDEIDHDGFATVVLKPGVMDPVALSVVNAAHDLGLKVDSVRTFRRYFGPKAVPAARRDILFGKVLANDAIEQVIEGPLALHHLALGAAYGFRLVTVPLRQLDDAALEKLSREGQLALNLAEMKAVQQHFRTLGRDATDVELETIAQTWSEHCSHKTLKGEIDFDGRRIKNLLKETIFGATQEIRRRLGSNDWCVSVFEDNAGVVRFDDQYHVCFKVETHNHPSAIEPYGGANTGIGGVIRDPLGTGLGAKPICNTDVFCFAPPDMTPEAVPAGVLHPRKIMKGVVAGVRDYGNRMGIATVNGAVCFDDRYLANPLVYCGTVGIIPVDRCKKEAKAGDLIVAVGGRTGRDGIHGATFSSIQLTSESEKISGGAVQIGNAIVEKKMLDVILQARSLGLYDAITDCGAGGFSSAVGEMAENIGAVVHLDRAPLKYEGLSYTEIWISESQERMILAVPPGNWEKLHQLCAGEDVEAAVIGTFEATGRLKLLYQENVVADLDLDFLHHGRPNVVRKATSTPHPNPPPQGGRELGSPSPSMGEGRGGGDPPRQLTDVLLKILSSYNVCSKEWIIRQYDHEVQGGTVIKPLVGVRQDGPGDAAVIVPVLGSWAGLAVGCGINPRYGDLDPYAMAAAVIDEALRNVVAVGADPERTALLDNFCWGNTDRPEVLGSLVRAAEACRDVALALGTPFISGKDSLNNEFHSGACHITIPPTLLISSLGRVLDVRRCVTMDLKEAGNELYLLGITRNEMGGSHYNLVMAVEGGDVPKVDLETAPRIFRKLHQAIQNGLIRSCHDCSEGGLAVAVAEMAFAGEVGADIQNLDNTAGLSDEVLLFAESTTRFVLEVTPVKAAALRECLGGDVPCRKIGQTVKEPRLRIAGSNGEWIIWAQLADLKAAWQKPLTW